MYFGTYVYFGKKLSFVSSELQCPKRMCFGKDF